MYDIKIIILMQCCQNNTGTYVLQTFFSEAHFIFIFIYF